MSLPCLRMQISSGFHGFWKPAVRGLMPFQAAQAAPSTLQAPPKAYADRLNHRAGTLHGVPSRLSCARSSAFLERSVTIILYISVLASFLGTPPRRGLTSSRVEGFTPRPSRRQTKSPVARPVLSRLHPLPPTQPSPTVNPRLEIFHFNYNNAEPATLDGATAVAFLHQSCA
jgi:hypothetical protein